MGKSGITVWGIGTGRAHRVHWALEELDLDYHTLPIQARSGETLTKDYTQLNPKQKIPFLQDGAFHLSESAAIVNYLFKNYGEGRDVYLPKNACEQARLDEWCYFVMTELDAHSLYLIRRHEALAKIYGAAPEAVASAREYCRKQLTAVEDRIAALETGLMGSDISPADILLTSCLDWAVAYGLEIGPKLSPYRNRMNRRRAYITAWDICRVPDS